MLKFQQHAVRVFVVAPPMVSWGLERLLASAHPRFEVIGVAGGLDEALPMLKRQPTDLVLLDFDGNESVAAIEELLQHTKAWPVLITASQDQSLLDRVVLAGVRGVLEHTDAPATLLMAIEKVHEGQVWLDRHAIGRVFLEMARQKAATGIDPEKLKISTLTVRERQAIAAVASDVSVPAKVIAGRLCISENTLRNHLTSVYSKLDVSNRLDLYAYAIRHGLNMPDDAYARTIDVQANTTVQVRPRRASNTVRRPQVGTGIAGRAFGAQSEVRPNRSSFSDTTSFTRAA